MRRTAGTHVPNSKNRSSKHLNILIGTKSVYRCLNNAMLKELSSSGNPQASKELARRAKKTKKA